MDFVDDYSILAAASVLCGILLKGRRSKPSENQKRSELLTNDVPKTHEWVKQEAVKQETVCFASHGKLSRTHGKTFSRMSMCQLELIL